MAGRPIKDDRIELVEPALLRVFRERNTVQSGSADRARENTRTMSRNRIIFQSSYSSSSFPRFAGRGKGSTAAQEASGGSIIQPKAQQHRGIPEN